MERKVKYHKFRGTAGLKEIIDSFNDVIVYFDPDVDGMVAGYFVCKYLHMHGKRFQWFVNKDRLHDWSLDLSKCAGRDIIAVDFRIPSCIIKDTVQAGCNIVSMDHHVSGDSFISVKSANGKRGIVINNQYSFEEEDGRYLSGAGVVFETLRLLDESFDTTENRALVGLTLLSDVCEIENPLAAGYLYDLYNHKKEGYIGYLIDHTMGGKDYGFGSPRMDRSYVDFKFSPAINSNLRFGNENDVVRFFLGSGKLDLECHSRQKELVKAIQKSVTVKEFSNLRVVFYKDWEVKSNESVDSLSGFVGLVASRYLDGKKSVIAYVVSIKEDGTKYVKRASFRGNLSTADYLTGIRKFVTAEGHPTAFGIKEMVPSRELFSSINDVCAGLDATSAHSCSVRPVINMSVYSGSRGRETAEKNMYCLSRNRSYVRYIGKGISVKRSGENYTEYSVDGVSVMCFDNAVNFSNGLIFPILERGYVKYYLQLESL